MIQQERTGTQVLKAGVFLDLLEYLSTCELLSDAKAAKDRV